MSVFIYFKQKPLKAFINYYFKTSFMLICYRELFFICHQGGRSGGGGGAHGFKGERRES